MGEGRGGIRLRDKAAGTGCLAGSRSYCVVVLPKSLGHCAEERTASSLAYFLFSEVIWIFFFWWFFWPLTDRGLIGPLLCFTTIFSIHGACVGMVIYLRKSIHSLLSVFKKKGECWLTWRNLAGCSFDFGLLTQVNAGLYDSYTLTLL